VSESSPSDLAVAFRSFGRRHREAVAALDASGRAAAAAHERALGDALARAAAALGVPARGDVAAVGTAVADKVAAVHPDRWDDAVLATVRREAVAAGAALRAIADLAG
jgi:hypothetical protein